jgi:outer membrane protein insertion porin family/translocation and assembly module TamA
MHRPGLLGARARSSAVVFVAAALVLAPYSLSAQGGDQREAPEVRDLDLNGVHGVSRADLARSIATSKSECRSLLWLPFCLLSRSPTLWDREYLDHDEFRRDVLRIQVFYWKRGYRDAQVDTSVVALGENRVRVVFDITEGPPTVIASLRVQYDSTLVDEARVRKLSILRAGDPLNLIVLDTMRLMLQAEMWNKGHADAQVDTAIVIDPQNRVANVVLRVDPNWRTTVGTITVRGNEEVDVRTIQNSIMLRPGEPFRYIDLIESQRNLYESNLFRLAQLTVASRPDSIKNIEIEVREAKMQEARVAGGFNNIDFVQFDGRYTNYNTFGGARRFDVTGAIGNIGAGSLAGRGIFRQPSTALFDQGVFELPTWQVSADVKQPAWLQKPENAVAIGGFAHRRAAPAVYIDRGYGGQLSFTRTLAPRATASSAYKYEITRVEAGDVYFCVNYGVCDDPTIATLRRHQRLNPFAISGSIDRSDIPFSPTKGYLARVDLEHASGVTLSDYRFNRVFAEASAYTHFRYPSRDPRAQVLAGHLRLGYVRPLGHTSTIEVLHPGKRFYAGGANSVRGYGENQLGPRILTIAPERLAEVGCDISFAAIADCAAVNDTLLLREHFTPRPVGGTSLLEGSVEFRYPISHKMEWAVFLDGAILGGSELSSLSDVRLLVSGAGAITPGVGFRYRSPVGPIRVDLGYNPPMSEDLDVVTTATDSTGRTQLVRLREKRRFESGGSARGLWALFNRLVLHLSIGQAY